MPADSQPARRRPECEFGRGPDSTRRGDDNERAGRRAAQCMPIPEPAISSDRRRAVSPTKVGACEKDSSRQPKVPLEDGACQSRDG